MADRKGATLERTVRLTEEQADELQGVADYYGLNFAEILADAVKTGAPILVDRAKSSSVYNRTKRRDALGAFLDELPASQLDAAILIVRLLTSLPPEKYEEAIAYLKSLKD